MFNLLVKYTQWADNQDKIGASRIFEHTDSLVAQRFISNGSPDLTKLITLPTLFMQETAGKEDQVSRVGTIIRAYPYGGEIALEYFYDPNVPPIPNRQLQVFAQELGINGAQFQRTHWSVKDTDLFRTLLRHSQPRRARATVFRLADPEAIEPNLVSAMMPFHPSFTPVYETLQRIAVSSGFYCRRADDIWENPAVMQDVVSLIDRSRVVVCDCTGRNPNVFYEIGIAHTMGREVILITQSEHDIPFDLRHLRYVSYLNNGEGLAHLAERVKTRLDSLR